MIRSQMIFPSLLLSALASWGAATPTAAQTVIDRNLANKLGKAPAGNVGTLLTSMITTGSKAGSWAGIGYADTNSQGDWAPLAHVSNLAAIARVYADPASSYYKSTDALDKLRMGLDFWDTTVIRLGTTYSNRIHCQNWYNNRIGAAGPLGSALVLIQSVNESDGSPVVRQDTLERWAKYLDKPYLDAPYVNKKLPGDQYAWYEEVGSNFTDVGGIHLDGCIVRQNKGNCVDSVLQIVRDSLHVVDAGCGIHRDSVFSMHSGSGEKTLVYNGGYGYTFVKGMLVFYRLAVGTTLAFEPEKVALFSGVMVGGNAWMTHNGKWDPMVLGRTIARSGMTRGASGLNGVADQLLAANIGRTNDLNLLKTWVGGKAKWPWPANTDRCFWTALYQIHHGPGWTTSLRGASTDVSATETTNGEDIKAWFLAYGSTWTYVRGDEHDGIWPTMDWARVPGVTCDRIDTFPWTKASKGTNRGETNFVGGVSDGNGSAFAYNYSVSEIKAKKAWFQTSDATIALAAGLTFGKPVSVNTSVDQRLAHGSSTAAAEITGREKVTMGFSDASIATLGKDSANYPNLRWVHHDSVGYWFPADQKVWVASRDQSGSWLDINNGETSNTTPVTKKIFSSWIEHGKSATNGSYAYAVVPGVSADSMKKWVAKAGVSIDTNSTFIQAVSQGTFHAVVFHAAGTVKFAGGLTLKASAPCAVVLRDREGGDTMTVADPGTTSASIRFVATKGSASKAFIVALPTGARAASPAALWIPLPSTGIVPHAATRPSTHLVRSGNRLTISDLPEGRNSLAMIDQQGRTKQTWKTSESILEVEIPSQVQTAILLVHGHATFALRVPPLP